MQYASSACTQSRSELIHHLHMQAILVGFGVHCDSTDPELPRCPDDSTCYFPSEVQLDSSDTDLFAIKILLKCGTPCSEGMGGGATVLLVSMVDAVAKGRV